MSKIVITIADNEESGGIIMTMNPTFEKLVAKVKQETGATSAEGLTIHLARKALEYNARMKSGQSENSPIVIPKMT